jgi:hypothetical protein
MFNPARLMFVCCIFVALGSALLYLSAPLSLKQGLWTHEVLENWNDYGLWNLKGKLVTNPGGADVLTKPKSYAGHSPVIFYLAFVVRKIAGAFGGVTFFVLLTLSIAVSIFFLLGRDAFALLAACTSVLSMGYARTTIILDPVPIPVSLGIPYSLFVIKVLGRERLSVLSWMSLASVTAGYAILNWTTAFLFAALAGFLFVWLKGRVGRWLGFVFTAGLGAVAIGGFLYLQKAGSGASGGQSFYNLYLFGPIGYDGSPMTWTRAGIRLASATVIGLFPLLLVHAWQLYRCATQRGLACLSSLLPVLFAIIAVCGMRNYFAHHQWMAPPVLMTSIVLSMRLLKTPTFNHSLLDAATRLRLRSADFAIVGASLAYACLIAVASGANIQQDDFIQLIKNNSSRSDFIAFSAARDPWIAANKIRLEEACDRKFVELNRDRPLRPPVQHLLTAVEYPAPAKWKARSSSAPGTGQPIVEKLLTFYRTYIAARKPGDRMEIPTFYLYDASELLFSTNAVGNTGL